MAKKTKEAKALKRIVRFIQRPTIRPIQEIITKEQAFLRGMFGGGEKLFGTGKNLPKIEGILIKGGGLIKNDDFGETAGMFGMRRRRREEFEE